MLTGSAGERRALVARAGGRRGYERWHVRLRRRRRHRRARRSGGDAHSRGSTYHTAQLDGTLQHQCSTYNMTLNDSGSILSDLE